MAALPLIVFDGEPSQPESQAKLVPAGAIYGLMARAMPGGSDKAATSRKVDAA